MEVDGQCKCCEKGLSGKETPNRAVWRQLVRNINPIQKWENMWWKKKIIR